MERSPSVMRKAPPMRRPGALWLFLVALMFPGCLVVRITEQRIRLNKDGSGSAVLRLTDLRSDARTDSGAFRDYGTMMGALDQEKVKDFEGRERRLTGKRFMVHGDTLIAEVTYQFSSLGSIDGLNVTDDMLFIIVAEGDEVVKTNGKVESWGHTGTRIVWDRNATSLVYQIRQAFVPESYSLAPYYLKYGS